MEPFSHFSSTFRVWRMCRTGCRRRTDSTSLSLSPLSRHSFGAPVPETNKKLLLQSIAELDGTYIGALQRNGGLILQTLSGGMTYNPDNSILIHQGTAALNLFAAQTDLDRALKLIASAHAEDFNKLPPKFQDVLSLCPLRLSLALSFFFTISPSSELGPYI